MFECENDVAKFKAKHDEMFASTSSLNARIEELEQHKLHLLDKLKSYGDRGDLGYIVKTQKLTEIKKEKEGEASKVKLPAGEDQEATVIKQGSVMK